MNQYVYGIYSPEDGQIAISQEKSMKTLLYADLEFNCSITFKPTESICFYVQLSMVKHNKLGFKDQAYLLRNMTGINI